MKPSEAIQKDIVRLFDKYKNAEDIQRLSLNARFSLFTQQAIINYLDEQYEKEQKNEE